MVIGEYKYAVNQHVKSFHDRPSNEFDVFFKAAIKVNGCCKTTCGGFGGGYA
jgi:hypothetical protein